MILLMCVVDATPKHVYVLMMTIELHFDVLMMTFEKLVDKLMIWKELTLYQSITKQPFNTITSEVS